MGAVLGVMLTRPAARFREVVRECVVAVLVASVAAFAANAYDAHLFVTRAGYLVLGVALLGALALAYRLAAGLHGLGRRGVVMLVSGIGLLAVSLAYTEALARWGSPGWSARWRTPRPRCATGSARSRVRPSSCSASRRWPGASPPGPAGGRAGGAPASAPPGSAVVATSLLDHRVPLLEAGLATVWSLVGGLVLGYLVIRADSFLSGARGRRARRLEEAAAHRPEPGRAHALM